MSLFYTVTAHCPACEAANTVQLSASVNADRRPDLREAILDGTFQATTCSSCGAAVRLPSHITYIDMRRRQWILVEAIARIDDWQAVETEATDLFNESFGPAAPPVQREVGADLQTRLVFGWPALREKLIAGEAGLDDVVLELMKIAVLRNVPAPPMSDGTEMRLVVADAETLTMRWIESVSEKAVADLPIERSLYDDLAADLEPWAALKAELEAGRYVDVNRILRG
jgi:hypothetical protein